MTGSSPADLAVAFRSFRRRADDLRRQADESGRRDQVDGELEGLASIFERAAARLGTSPDTEAIAVSILATAAHDWQEALLAGLRQDALDAGGVLRHAEAATSG